VWTKIHPATARANISKAAGHSYLHWCAVSSIAKRFVVSVRPSCPFPVAVEWLATKTIYDRAVQHKAFLVRFRRQFKSFFLLSNVARKKHGE